MQVPIKLGPNGTMPTYGSDSAACFDLYAAKETDIGPNCITTVPLDIYMAVPVGYELQIRSRSGMSLNKKLTVANQPGTIDSDYRGEIKVLIHNHNPVGVVIEAGERIAQGLISPVPSVSFNLVDKLDSTQRGDGGFGSTGST